MAIPFKVLTEEEFRFEGQKAFLLSSMSAEPLPDGSLYAHKLVFSDGSSQFHPAFRNMDSETLMSREFPGKGYDRAQRYMSVVALTHDQITTCRQIFGMFVGSMFIPLSNQE
jgi:hypothetical protein